MTGSRVTRLIAPALAIVGVLVLWQVLVLVGVLPERYFPTMTETVAEFWSLLGTPDFWQGVGDTLQGWVLGLGIAVVLAIPLGLLVGSSRWLFRAFRVPVEFLRPIPSVALIPVAVLVYGTGLQSKVFLAAFAAFWPLFIQTLYGMHDTDPVASDTARAFGLRRWERVWRVRLPSAVPYIVTGVRISSAVALILAVTAELVIGAPGLGREINIARSGGALESMYALILATGLLGWGLNSALSVGERRLLRWHPSQREVTA